MDKHWVPTVAGALEIVAAVSALIGALVFAFACGIIQTVPDIRNDPDVPVMLIVSLLGTMAGLIGLGGLVCLAGGIAGIRRRGWIWALAGAIAAMFVLPPAGVPALILVIIGEREFGERAGAGSS